MNNELYTRFYSRIRRMHTIHTNIETYLHSTCTYIYTYYNTIYFAVYVIIRVWDLLHWKSLVNPCKYVLKISKKCVKNLFFYWQTSNLDVKYINKNTIIVYRNIKPRPPKILTDFCLWSTSYELAQVAYIYLKGFLGQVPTTWLFQIFKDLILT